MTKVLSPFDQNLKITGHNILQTVYPSLFNLNSEWRGRGNFKPPAGVPLITQKR